MIPKSVCLSHISFLNSTLINSITFFVFLHFFLNVLTIMGLFFLKSISHSPLFSSAHTGPDFCSLRTSEIPESWLPSGIKPWETHVERQTAGEKEGCNYSPVLVSLLIAVAFLPWLQLLQHRPTVLPVSISNTSPQLQ